MLTLIYSITLLLGLFAVITAALLLIRRRLPAQNPSAVDAIDALLPQTQCAQCGYPGCRPYAQAVAEGAPIDLCPPGGADTQAALARLLNRVPGPPLDAATPVRARIDEARCVGCYLCIEACPVDAIVGAPRFLHTVIAERCTGCELCLPPCPMDCIDLVPVAVPVEPVLPADSAPCIRCNLCEPVCPEALAPQNLWWHSRGEDLSRAQDLGLERCIECGLCNPVCPGNIDLVGVFKVARKKLANRALADRQAAKARGDHEQHLARLERDRLIAAERRDSRIAALTDSER